MFITALQGAWVQLVEVKIKKLSSGILVEDGTFNQSTDSWSIDSTFDASAYFYDNDLVIEQSVELASVMELDAGGMDFEFQYNDSLWAYIFDTTYIEEDTKGYAIEVLLDSVPIYWGAITKSTITRDFISQSITLQSVNIFKFYLDSIKHKTVKNFGVAYTTVGAYIMEYFESDIIDDISVELGDVPVDLDISFLADLETNGMPIGDFFEEIQKQYAAFLYVSEDKILHIVNRGYTSGTSTTIDGLLLDSDYYISNEEREYNSVVVNVVSSYWSEFGGVPTELPTYDWALIYEEDGERKIEFLFEDTSTIPNIYRWLDLRQKLNYNETSESYEKGVVWKMYGTDQDTFGYGFSIIDSWYLYENMVHQMVTVNCVCLGTDFNIFDSVVLDSQSYQIFSLTKNYKNNTTELFLKRLI